MKSSGLCRHLYAHEHTFTQIHTLHRHNKSLRKNKIESIKRMILCYLLTSTCVHAHTQDVHVPHTCTYTHICIVATDQGTGGIDDYS